MAIINLIASLSLLLVASIVFGLCLYSSEWFGINIWILVGVWSGYMSTLQFWSALLLLDLFSLEILFRLYNYMLPFRFIRTSQQRVIVDLIVLYCDSLIFSKSRSTLSWATCIWILEWNFSLEVWWIVVQPVNWEFWRVWISCLLFNESIISGIFVVGWLLEADHIDIRRCILATSLLEWW